MISIILGLAVVIMAFLLKGIEVNFVVLNWSRKSRKGGAK